MGAGILPVAKHQGKLYFLLGKENRHADTPGWADFGGGNSPGESNMQTATRECSEELTGFVGSASEIRGRIRKEGVYTLRTADKRYTTYVLRMDYDDALVHYYNANQRFLQRHMDPAAYKKGCIFEKSEIRWVTAEEMVRMRPQFRSYYREMVDLVMKHRQEIVAYANK